jgi:hypothetical protein
MYHIFATFPQLAAPHGLFYDYDQLCFAQVLAAGLAAPLCLPQGGLSRWYFYYRSVKKQKAVFPLSATKYELATIIQVAR